MRINADLHAPPIVRLTWDGQIFKGVVEALNISYTLFTPDGIPIRAKLNLTLKEYRPVEVQVKESPKSSPDVEKRYVVRRGDTLSSIAGAAYGDPTLCARSRATTRSRIRASWRRVARSTFRGCGDAMATRC